MRENTDQKNSEYLHILRSGCFGVGKIEKWDWRDNFWIRISNLPKLR